MIPTRAFGALRACTAASTEGASTSAITLTAPRHATSVMALTIAARLLGTEACTCSSADELSSRKSECRERGADAMQAERLFSELPAPEQQAQPEKTIHDDHDGGKHRISGERRGRLAPETISDTINATSSSVTTNARTSVPNGSPTRCATTSA